MDTTRRYPRTTREAFRDAEHAQWLEHHRAVGRLHWPSVIGAIAGLVALAYVAARVFM